LDGTTVKNMKFISTAMKIFSVLGIISGVFQLIVFLIGIFTIIISIKFFKAATFLEEAIYTKDENKLAKEMIDRIRKTHWDSLSEAMKKEQKEELKK